jgi:predicted Zn-dependent protease
MLGICLFQTKHTAEAIRELSLYVNTNPADAEGHYYLGSALRAAGREDQCPVSPGPCSQTSVAME